MEKISVYCPKQKTIFRTRWKEIQCYRAADVDAMLADVRRLVESARKIYHDATWSKIKPPGWMYEELKEAIDAVERHFTGKQT